MPYRWKNNIDVDETVVVIKNVLDKNPELPAWFVGTICGAIADSDPMLGKYFNEQQKIHAPGTAGYFTEAFAMPHGWRTKIDVDQTVVVIKDHLDSGPELPGWLVGTINRTVSESEPALGMYFFGELKKYAPAAMKYFETGAARV
jgi:hypothetical protein